MGGGEKTSPFKLCARLAKRARISLVISFFPAAVFQVVAHDTGDARPKVSEYEGGI
jgi:hypothetical protein